jgi:hypothetical protein
VCEYAWFERVKMGKTDRRHNVEHIFLRVPCAVPGDSSCFIVPNPVPLSDILRRNSIQTLEEPLPDAD